MLVMSTLFQIFGAFCSESWSRRKKEQSRLGFFGTGECFVFQLDDLKGHVYPWVGSGSAIDNHGQELFMAADLTDLVVGGGYVACIKMNYFDPLEDVLRTVGFNICSTNINVHREKKKFRYQYKKS